MLFGTYMLVAKVWVSWPGVVGDYIVSAVFVFSCMYCTEYFLRCCLDVNILFAGVLLSVLLAIMRFDARWDDIYMWARLLLVGEVSACRVSGVSRGIVCGKYMLKDVVAGCCASVQLL